MKKMTFADAEYAGKRKQPHNVGPDSTVGETWSSALNPLV